MLALLPMFRVYLLDFSQEFVVYIEPAEKYRAKCCGFRGFHNLVTCGENVYSGEVEAVIYGHPAVREVAVFGVPDPQRGELVMACVVLKPGASLTSDDLMAFCRRSLASYKLPRCIEFSETDLPKNSSGKILKKNLRERFWTHEERAVSRRNVRRGNRNEQSRRSATDTFSRVVDLLVEHRIKLDALEHVLK